MHAQQEDNAAFRMQSASKVGCCEGRGVTCENDVRVLAKAMADKRGGQAQQPACDCANGPLHRHLQMQCSLTMDITWCMQQTA
jgi:hypothetical protein